MKKLLGFLAVFVLVLAGCGKKNEVKIEKQPKDVALNLDGSKTIQKTGSDDFIVVDEDSPALEEFAFVDDDLRDAGEEAGDYLAEADIDEINEKEIAALSQEADAVLAFDEDIQFDNVQYALNGHHPLKSQKEALENNIEKAKEIVAKGNSISVSGHGCQLGDARFNMGLSVKRANAIKNEMLSAGISEDKIIVVGCGQECHLVTSTSQSRDTMIKELALNRRVEMTVIKS